MSDDVVARLASLEALIIGTMGLLFAVAGNDPDQSKQKALLGVLAKEFEDGLGYLPQAIQGQAKSHMSDLLDRVILRTNQLRADQRPN
ncbi:hypothetical protein ABIF64_006861 [Bradyrhizobium japonicum]|uniref:hypothetical protein n=1 Tax=Bradyrhizobium japonicum TaxID=375 RepID=UPI0033932130